MMIKRAGFTIIELLIVVAIIAILAAIAIPNLLEAQTRSKVSRVKADLRTMQTALESYAVDENAYPFDGPVGFAHYGWATALQVLTTPVSYLSSLPADVFQDDRLAETARLDQTNYVDGRGGDQHSYDYATARWQDLENNPADKMKWQKNFGNSAWKMSSAGPDRSFTEPGNFYGFEEIYDASNGTISAGDIIKSAGRST